MGTALSKYGVCSDTRNWSLKGVLYLPLVLPSLTTIMLVYLEPR